MFVKNALLEQTLDVHSTVSKPLCSPAYTQKVSKDRNKEGLCFLLSLPCFPIRLLKSTSDFTIDSVHIAICWQILI